MREFTDTRGAGDDDELWLLQHHPVFTQGQAGKPEHVLATHGDIPLVQSDRGGQVTYHGPGQLIAYPLLNIKRLGLGARALVTALEQSVIDILANYGISAEARPDAPGVYVQGRKIASLGLRIRRGCSYHGVSINHSLDLNPYTSINPCGYPEMQMTRLSDLLATEALPDFDSFQLDYAQVLAKLLGSELR